MHSVKKSFLFLLAALFAAAGCSQQKILPPEPVQGEILKSLGLNILASGEKRLTIQQDMTKISLFKEKKGVDFNGVAVYLPDPVKVSDKNVWEISERSADTILKPLLEKRNFSIRKIIIDPGHGGNDPGVISPHGVSEKHLNLLLAQSVANELKKSGFEVALTREKDVFIPLDKRVEDLDKNKFDLFISIHHNSSARTTASGLEIFLPEPQDENSCKRVSQTAYLAFALHKKLAPLNYFPGRGVKLARFKVLRLAKVPALLIEVGFLNHPMESAYLATAYFRKNFAAALTQEITAFASEQR